MLIEKYKECSGRSFSINIRNISSSTVCEEFDLNPTDFNGWQCNWWDSAYESGYKLNFFVGAWYSTCNISIGD